MHKKELLALADSDVDHRRDVEPEKSGLGGPSD